MSTSTTLTLLGGAAVLLAYLGARLAVLRAEAVRVRVEDRRRHR
ncbi:hypothetical protein [Amaricoccus solimangrovi]|nr:hypothetical protein [Amaricoccus solimangrovi]